MKNLHMAFAVLTISGFVLRGFWMMRGSPWLAHPLVRLVPHVLDALFLVSGIILIRQLHLVVMQNPWLLAKFAALIVYIFLGAIALRHGRSLRTRVIAFAGALLAFAYIAGAALSKSPLSWLA